jgi:hypothetical protein
MTDFFWDLAQNFLAQDGIDEGTLMGFPCLRVRGDFFATCDHRTGDLIVKLPRERVAELVDSRAGHSFAPAGKVFKEWMRVEERDSANWVDLMSEACEFVGGSKP